MDHGSATTQMPLISLFEERDKQELRDFLATAWTLAHEEELGSELTKQLVARLESEDLGGVDPGEHGKLYLAKSQEKIVGSLACALRGEVVFIWACYLASDFQRKGLGRLMMKQAVSEFPADKVAGIYVLEGNEEARQFYQKLGFIDCGETEFEVIADTYTPARVMQVRIANLNFD
ncbi:Acetyltransferase (GNAT) family protein [Pseudovibrio ascidiaceicola]|uniref:Acetyltransferase (GNAT) family protein n=1 Tax=Pseudovibrio ascidiaceicola TaxID=285279 RepID=A0A1I3ZSU8_9HYPH|nr:GNAT family N-acetyltransferase [Pseudovibrio ascidiaceicola]SFK46639.1 Acetyltransferase (GNAT) family protein [Pseudovibrio ascidiaceicola]